MADLYIHIGTHKTGTTTIQSALRNAFAESGSQGWCLLSPPYELLCRLMVCHEFSPSITQELRESIERAVHATHKAQPNQKFVLSFEGFSGAATEGYSNSEVVARMLAEATRTFQAKIVVYLRRQDDWLESMYTQKIHEGESYDFDAFLRRFDQTGWLDFDKLIRSYQKEFGDVALIVRSYHTAAEQGIVKDFGGFLDSATYLLMQRRPG